MSKAQLRAYEQQRYLQYLEDDEDMGLTPEKTKEGIMADTKRKPRVAKAPKVIEKVEVAKVYLNAEETKKLYKLFDRQRGHTGALATANYVRACVQLRTKGDLPVTYQYLVNTDDITRPVIIVKDFPPVVEAPARKPRAAKPKVDLPKVAVTRKPKAE